MYRGCSGPSVGGVIIFLFINDLQSKISAAVCRIIYIKENGFLMPMNGFKRGISGLILDCFVVPPVALLKIALTRTRARPFV